MFCMASAKLLGLLNKAIADEMQAAIQYMWQHVQWKGVEHYAVTEGFKKVAMDEMKHLPGQYLGIAKRFKKYRRALENLGKAAKEAGPIDDKTSHLIQMAAAAAIRSEGAVHSHARRALQAGASPDELHHAIILLSSTIGFPTVSAALSWVDDVLSKKLETRD